MKKSFLYAAQVALITALLFTGCPQDSDDDDDSGGKTVTPPGSDLSYIAYAFGDGIDTVKAVNHIYLGSNELVIPKGKTLDLATENVYIQEITGESKIIAQGTILFAKAQSYKGTIDFTAAPNTAKIIADRDFITRNVWIDYFDNGVKPRFPETAWDGIPAEDRPNGDPNTAVIKARWQQIVLIDTFENFKNYSDVQDGQGYIFVEPLSGGEGYAGKYLAIEAPAEGIEDPDVDVINNNAGGLRLYLIGEPVIFANSSLKDVDLSKPQTPGIYRQWVPSDPVTQQNVTNGFDTLFAAGGTGDGSLTVAGNAEIVEGGKIIATGGFTVWGVLKNKVSGTDTSVSTITGTDTPVTAWTARLDGGVFSGKVSLPGSIRNTFGSNVEFREDVEIAGPSTFSSAKFNGDALFSGPVKFEPGEGTGVEFDKNVTFADDAYLNNYINFKGGDESVTYYKKLSGEFDYNTIASFLKSGNPSASVEIPIATVTPPESGTFKDNIVFSGENVTVTKTAMFEKGATFEGNVTFNGTPTFGTLAEAALNANGAITSTTEIKGLAVFNSGADFGGTVNAKGDPLGNKVIIEEADFRAGALSGIGNLVLGNSANPKVTFGRASGSTNQAGAGTITIADGSGITFKEDTLTLTGAGGTIDGKTEFNDVKIALDQNAVMTFGTYHEGNLVSVNVVSTPGAESAGFEIKGHAKLDFGQIVGLDSTPAELKATGGIVLEVPVLIGTDSAEFKLVLDNSIINLTEGGTIAFAGSGSNIYMINKANVITGTEASGYALGPSPANTDTGVIIATAGDSEGTRAALVTGSLGTNNTWHVGTLAGTQWVTNPPEGYSSDAYANLLYNGNGFVTSVITSPTAKGGSSSAYSGNNGDPAGSIAVFKTY
jgi:hypothetical protein